MIDPEGRPIIEVPAVEVDTEMGPIVLTWLNTTVRTFREDTYNHVEYTDDEGKIIGFLTPQNVLDALFEREYPYSFNPITDEQTINWYVWLQAERLDAELKEL